MLNIFGKLSKSNILIISLIILILVQISCSENTNPVNSAVVNSAKTEIITPQGGGIIELTEMNVGVIQLIFPPNAVADTEQITLQILKTSLPNPFSNNFLPGIRVLPSGLSLDSLVSLKIILDKPVDDTSKAILFYLKDQNLALPLKTRWINNFTVIGEIYHFSDYGGAFPTEQEILNQANSLITQFECDVSNWQEFGQFVSAMLKYIEMAQLLGYDDLSQQLINQLEQKIIEQVSNFLDLPIPEEPCGNYIHALLKYSEMVFMIVNNQDLTERCQNRINEVLNRCYIRGEIEFDHNYFWSGDGTIQRTRSGFVPFYINTMVEPYGQLVGSGVVEWNGVGNTDGCVGTEVLTGNVTLSGDMEIDNQNVIWLNVQITETYSGTITVVCPEGSGVLPMNPPTTVTNVSFLMEDGATVINSAPAPFSGYLKWILHLQLAPQKLNKNKNCQGVD